MADPFLQPGLPVRRYVDAIANRMALLSEQGQDPDDPEIQWWIRHHVTPIAELLLDRLKHGKCDAASVVYRLRRSVEPQVMVRIEKAWLEAEPQPRSTNT